MQALIKNAEKRSLQQLLSICNNQRASNSLTAAAVLLMPQEDQSNFCLYLDNDEIAAG